MSAGHVSENALLEISRSNTCKLALVFTGFEKEFANIFTAAKASNMERTVIIRTWL